MSTFRRILFATDFSAACRQVFQRAMDLAQQNRAELLIAHAYQSPALLPTDAYVAPAVYEELDTKLRDSVEKQLKELADEARKAGIEAKPMVLFGVPYEAITEAARETKADLVVMGTHGRTGVSRFFLGSVAARVISSAPCPVMTVRAA